MIIKSYYDEDTLTDKVWYDSSSVFYSEFVENKDDNKGNLYVTFKNGSTYLYKNVDMAENYLMFKNGGLDGSQGKALNKYVKPECEYEKTGGKTIQVLQEELDALLNKQNEKYDTWFISGHRDITEDEFEVYKYAISSIVNEYANSKFIMGDYMGVDIMAQNYLIDTLDIDPERITVYHMNEKPMFLNPKIKNLKGGFKNDSERDAAMTLNSNDDIAFVRDCKKMSGTAENILRRRVLSDNSIFIIK